MLLLYHALRKSGYSSCIRILLVCVKFVVIIYNKLLDMFLDYLQSEDFAKAGRNGLFRVLVEKSHNKERCNIVYYCIEPCGKFTAKRS
jgi:hypothetical protein